METAALNSEVRTLVAEYGVFWEFCPHLEQIGGERQLVGFEVELIGSHKSGLNHVDPGCASCRSVRSFLLGIASRLRSQVTIDRSSLTYDVDSHSNSIMCLPAIGNRAAVWVTAYFSAPRAGEQSLSTEVLERVKSLLNTWGIHQR